jgi:hypothetical protein
MTVGKGNVLGRDHKCYEKVVEGTQNGFDNLHQTSTLLD